jgi:hypothetical protein
MVEVLKLAGPSIILLDEFVAFARQLPDDRFSREPETQYGVGEPDRGGGKREGLRAI